MEKALCIFPENAYEPDICYWGPAKAENITPDNWKHPVPDFVVEVLSKSTEQRDRGIKKMDYERNGVREYWIVDSKLHTVECYILNAKGKYMRLPYKSILRPSVFPGLAFPEAAVFSEIVNDRVCNSLFLPTFAEEMRRLHIDVFEAQMREEQARNDAREAQMREEQARNDAREAQNEAIKLKYLFINHLYTQGNSIETIATLSGLSIADIHLILFENTPSAEI